jgi:capsular exopolysaccharide synthesis family protein
LQRYKEIGVAGGVGVNNISVVDAAELPEDPSSPNLPLNLLLSLLIGAFLGMGAAFALEQIDEGISDPADVENEIGVPLLGTIPKVTDKSAIEELQDRKSILSEAYVSLQTNLSFATEHGTPRSLAVTSSRPAEGKSTTSTALAISLARTGRRVLLIDADMRSPSLHGLFGLGNTVGLSNYLSGNDELGSLIHDTNHQNLSLMTAGPHPPSSPELLSSRRFGTLTELALQKFDHVILDSPPVMGLADAQLISSRVEGVIFVIEANGTHQSVVRAAVRRLVTANVVIMGAILTKFDQRKAQYGYGYEYGYGYGAEQAASQP